MDRPGCRPTWLGAGISIAGVVRARYSHAVSRRLSRAVTANSAVGIALMLGICAAVWFTAGTWAADVCGVIALGGGYLSWRAAGQLAQPQPTALLAGQVSSEVLATAGWNTAEYAVYAGLAIGGAVAGWTGTWILALIAMIGVAVRQTVTDCRSLGTAARRQAAIQLRLSAGLRVLIIAVAAVTWGPLVALYGLVLCAIIETGYAVLSAGPAAQDREPGRRGGPESVPSAVITAYRDDGRFARHLGRLMRGQIIPLPPTLVGLAATVMLAVLGLRSLPGIILLTPLVAMLLAAPGCSHPHDGRLDWLVPGLLQAGQYVYLSALGFAAGVPAAVIFALCAVTAIRYAVVARLSTGQPGTGSAQGGAQPSAQGGAQRPAQGGAQPSAQGGAQRPAQGGAQRSAQRPASRLDVGLGWEGRLLIAGLGAIVGVGMLAYLALTAYLGVLICSEIRTSYRAIGEDGRP